MSEMTLAGLAAEVAGLRAQVQDLVAQSGLAERGGAAASERHP